MQSLPNIRHLSSEALAQIFQEKNMPNYRATQVYEWLWKKGCTDFDEMTNLSKEIRTYLQSNFGIYALTKATLQVSTDTTYKIGFKTYDGHTIETVLIVTDTRLTACVSSQIGCSLNCDFCATGKMKRQRNLYPEEIYDQVVFLQKLCRNEFDKKLTNIVFMGMGEPLLNYKSVLKSIAYITDPQLMNMSARRITLSTAGIAKMIARLGEDKVAFNLALSLHAPTDKKRSEIMDINKTNDIPALITALNIFYKHTKNKITLEYVLLQNFNDTLKDAEDLALLYRKIPASLINLIEYNPIRQGRFSASTEQNTQKFMEYLQTRRINVRLRRSRGKDIDAACGQLAAKKNL